MRIENLVWSKITEDSAGKDGLWTPDQALNTEVVTNMTRMTGGVFSVAASGTETLSFGDVSAVYGLYIEVDNNFNVVFSGGSDTFNFRRADTTTGRKARCWMEADISSVSITNPSSSVSISGRYVLYGDPTS